MQEDLAAGFSFNAQPGASTDVVKSARGSWSSAAEAATRGQAGVRGPQLSKDEAAAHEHETHAERGQEAPSSGGASEAANQQPATHAENRRMLSVQDPTIADNLLGGSEYETGQALRAGWYNLHVRAKPAGGFVVGRILLGGPLSRVLGGACKCYPVLESLRFRTSVQVPRAKQGNVWYACLSDDLEAQLEAATAGVADAPAPELPRSRSRSRSRGTFGVTQDGAQGSFARRRT